MPPLSDAALHSRAVAAFTRRDFAEAEELLSQILSGNASDRAARFNLGKVYEVTERYEAAASAYETILVAAPADVPALLRLGTVRYVQGRLPPAAEAFAAALRVAPGDATAALNLGIVLNALGRFEAALPVLRAGADAHPDVVDLRVALAEALRELGEDAGAEEAARAALARDGGNVQALIVLGQVAYDRGDFAEAEARFGDAARLAPDRPEPRMNLGVLQHGLGRVDEALANAEAAVARAPHDALAHFDLGLTLLLAGYLHHGFEETEWRLRDPRVQNQLAWLESLPLWNGERLRGGRLLVSREQGLGDFVLWSRLFGEAKRRADVEVTVETPPPLAPLYAGFAGIDELAAGTVATARAGEFAAHVPLCSLPHVLGVDAPVVPAQPYLRADPARAAAYRERFAQLPGRLRVGIAWAGEPAHLLDRFRSCALADFGALAGVADVAWVSLQKGAREREALEPPAGMALLALGPELQTFADTAAAIAALDLVIAVDTAVIHLAGALGTPAWMLQGFGHYWLWGVGRADSPWYPSLRIFRQHRANEWRGAFGDVRAALTSLIATLQRD
jgi:tetratricopeptide (TPR) repeat protein